MELKQAVDVQLRVLLNETSYLVQFHSGFRLFVFSMHLVDLRMLEEGWGWGAMLLIVLDL